MLTDHSRNEALLRLREQHVPRGVASAHPIFAARADGARIWDVDGNEYIDFAGGIGVLNVGHNHPRVIRAAQAQLERFTHTCFQVAMYEPYVRLAEQLNALTPGSFAKKSIFFTSGAEATENAIKIARAYTGRPAVVAFTNSFHGRTLLGMSLTGKTRPYKQNFGPFAPEVYHAPFPYAYRGWTTERALAAIQELFETECAPERIAAIIIEPVLGEGGFVPAPEAFLYELRRITEQHGIVFIADEIQSGFGRTGKLFAIEWSGVVPDLVCVAKSLAGGFPLSGVTGRAEIMDAPAPGGLGGTYAGNPVACMAALAVLEVFKDEGILEQAQELGNQLVAACTSMALRHEEIGEVRGLGAMIALEFVRDRETKTPVPELVDQIVAEGRRHGLLLLKAGLYGNVLRIHVPLIIDDHLLTRALDSLHTVIESVLEPTRLQPVPQPAI